MPKSNIPFSLGESPLTDPRALASSAPFHVLVVMLASATVLTVAFPIAATGPKAALRRGRPRRQSGRGPSLTWPRWRWLR